MEIIGFIALFIVGGGVLLQGVGLMYITYGFSGRFSWPGLIIACVGATILYFTLSHAPFTIVLN